MGFALPLEWADAGSVRATTRFEADHAAAVVVRARAETEAAESHVS